MGRNGESGALGTAAARGGVASAGVGARFARFGTGIGIGAGTSNVASEQNASGPRAEPTKQDI